MNALLRCSSQVIFFFLALVLFALAGPAQAQETQVPLDEAGRLTTLDPGLERRLGLFPEYDDLREAQLFQIGPRRYELVVEYRRGGQTLRDRRALSAAEVEALRRRVSAQLAARQVQPNLDQEGRYKLLYATTTLGVAQGLLLPAAVDAENDDVYATGALLGAATGFFVPLLLTRNARVTEAAGTMAVYGNLQGLAHGGLLSLLLFGDDFEGQESSAAALTAALSAGETIAAYGLANRLRLRAGTAETISYGSLAGGFVSATLASVATGEGTNQDVSDDVYARSHAAAALGGSVAGSYLGYRLARAEGFTQGDARVWGLAGLITTQAAGAGLLLADEEGTRAAPAVLAAGAVGGLAAGRLLVRRRNFTTGQANIIALGSLAGSLLGSALALTTDASDDTAVALSAAGSVAGFGATYATYAGEARTRTAFGWQVEVNPYALYGQLSSGQADPAAAPAALTLRRTF